MFTYVGLFQNLKDLKGILMNPSFLITGKVFANIGGIQNLKDLLDLFPLFQDYKGTSPL